MCRMVVILPGLVALATHLGCTSTDLSRSSVPGAATRPSDLCGPADRDHPVYNTSFEDPRELADWSLEGGKRVAIEAGSLVLESDTLSQASESQGNHLVCWLKREIPADFYLEFTIRPSNRRQGLCIVFFNARGIDGQSIFDPSLKPRNGEFPQYHSGDLNNYHISYWAGGRGTSNLRKNKGFHLVASGPDLVESAPAEAFQTIGICKCGNRIQLLVDGQMVIDWCDDGKTYGPVHTHSGWIGLRQMAHTHRAEYGRLAVYPLKSGAN
jgi:hypothetical protein